MEPIGHQTGRLAAFDSLRSNVAGTLYEAGDPGYAELATPWNVAVRTSPAAVLEAATADDVVQAVRFAAANGLAVAVQATGHGIASDLDGALLVHTRQLAGCTVDPGGWARTGAGVTWKTVLAACADHGLAGLCGSSPGVSVAGYTSGGGIGPVARTFGAASDRVRSFDVVTGDGRLRHVTAKSEPDLFWGLRGGKSSLGIITTTEFSLLPLPYIYAGALFFGTDSVADVTAAWSQWCPTLPPEATTSLGLMQLPPMPGVPEPLAGKFTVAVRYVYTGNADDGARWLAPMRAAGAPLIDAVQTMPYSMIGLVHSDPEDAMPASEASCLLTDFSADAAETLVGAVGPETGSPQLLVEVRQFGGALSAEPEIASALCHRDAAFGLYSVGVAAPPELPAVADHAAGVQSAMNAWQFGASLPNFSAGGGAAGFAASYTPDVLARLSGLAAHYDPDSLFRLGQVPAR
ncbi:FAD-linked oxidase [Arthrobacter livingstonensis]|uniref:FAD-linked oxidase n=1 Tax=Arthrobacter livingstonensis TaxID=670078 RepID=A0A2V5L657_9MICC|nr:FAD-binding oxidoreductase [Arthrobacter livingstonensis]PYI66875.1 FAD-linked oxidase [Arthrobacter livingstonensis]